MCKHSKPHTHTHTHSGFKSIIDLVTCLSFHPTDVRYFSSFARRREKIFHDLRGEERYTTQHLNKIIASESSEHDCDEIWRKYFPTISSSAGKQKQALGRMIADKASKTYNLGNLNLKRSAALYNICTMYIHLHFSHSMLKTQNEYLR